MHFYKIVDLFIGGFSFTILSIDMAKLSGLYEIVLKTLVAGVTIIVLLRKDKHDRNKNLK